MVNLTEKAREMCQSLAATGFGGIGFHKSMVEEGFTLEDVWDEVSQTGELTPSQYVAWKENYVCFITEPDFPYDTSGDSPYVEFSVYESLFYRDPKQYIQRQLGDDVDVTFREGCHEFECVRKNYVHPH